MDAQQLRLERIADTEGTGRLANEQILKAAADHWGREGAALFRCECGDDLCEEPLRIPRDVYEGVRDDPMLFILVPGHEVPEAEDVVDTGDGYEVVRKRENVRHVVEASDPRTHT
jgi:hypothetical protein